MYYNEADITGAVLSIRYVIGLGRYLVKGLRDFYFGTRLISLYGAWENVTLDILACVVVKWTFILR